MIRLPAERPRAERREAARVARACPPQSWQAAGPRRRAAGAAGAGHGARGPEPRPPGPSERTPRGGPQLPRCLGGAGGGSSRLLLPRSPRPAHPSITCCEEGREPRTGLRYLGAAFPCVSSSLTHGAASSGDSKLQQACPTPQIIPHKMFAKNWRLAEEEGLFFPTGSGVSLPICTTQPKE